jgi:2-iminobutanoate/2-iminopropanoate deaminase
VKKPVNYPTARENDRPMGAAPLSPALDTGAMVFVSGQVGIDPASGTLAGDDVARQTRQALRNLGALLGAAGVGLDQVVKTTVFLVRTDDFDAMNAVYQEFFAPPYPTRSTVGVALATPALLVEIEGVALRER